MSPKHVVITGASSGIGEALVREYISRDARVTLVARRRALLEALAEPAKDRCHVVEADLSDVEHCTDWIAGAEAALGDIDILINNAGVQIVAATSETSWAEGERLLRVDLLTPLRLTHTMLPKMLARRSGCIVDISSMAALGPTPGMFFYNAAKGGLGAASEGLRAEARRGGVHVLTVYPGPVRTAMEVAGRAAYEASAAVRNVPTGDADVLARLVADAVERRKSRIVYPQIYGLSRHFPNLTRWFLDRLTPLTRGALPSP